MIKARFDLTKTPQIDTTIIADLLKIVEVIVEMQNDTWAAIVVNHDDKLPEEDRKVIQQRLIDDTTFKMLHDERFRSAFFKTVNDLRYSVNWKKDKDGIERVIEFDLDAMTHNFLLPTTQAD